MNMNCHACGARFRSMIAEARHRHNFPALCKRNKRFERWSRETNIEAMKEAFDKLEVGRLFLPVWVIGGNIHKALYIKLASYPGRSRAARVIAGSTSQINGEMYENARQYHYALEHAWFETKLRIDIPTDEQDAQFSMLVTHGQYQRAFAVVGFVLEASE